MAQDAVPREGRPAALDHSHPQAVCGVAADRPRKRPLAGRGAPMHQGQILLLHQAVPEHRLKRLHRVLPARDDHEPGGRRIQPVHDARPPHVVERPHIRIAPHQAVDERTAPVAGRGMDHQTGGLVHHQQGVVLVDDPKVHGLRLDPQVLGGRHFDAADRPLRNPQRGLRPEAAAGHAPLAHQPLGEGTGEPQTTGQQDVQPHPRVGTRAQDLLDRAPALFVGELPSRYPGGPHPDSICRRAPLKRGALLRSGIGTAFGRQLRLLSSDPSEPRHIASTGRPRPRPPCTSSNAGT